MNVKIKSLLINQSQLLGVDIYGISSRGIPGLEINGLGKRGKLLKEKINFITTRYLVTKKNMKRFVISVESTCTEEKIRDKGLDLELPIIVLYWTLLGVLPLKNLDECLAVGRVNVDFIVSSPSFIEIWSHPDRHSLVKNKILICSELDSPQDYPRLILWEDLLKQLQIKMALPSKDSGIEYPSAYNTVGATS